MGTASWVGMSARRWLFVVVAATVGFAVAPAFAQFGGQGRGSGAPETRDGRPLFGSEPQAPAGKRTEQQMRGGAPVDPSRIIGVWQGRIEGPQLQGDVRLRFFGDRRFALQVTGSEVEAAADGRYNIRRDGLSFNNSIFFRGARQSLVAVIDDAPVRMSDNDTLEIAVPVSIQERASADGAQQHVMTLRRSRERVRPDFGLMLHDDGDNTFIDGAAGVSTRRIEEHMRQIVDSPIKTVSYCIGTGVLFYPTRVGSSLGWRQTPFDTRAGWERIEFVRAGLARGEDPIRAGMAVLKQNGRIGLLSHRLSDAHFIKTPDTYPLVPKFYLDNRSLIIGRDKSPVQNDADYGNMLDFTHAAVRKYNYDIMAEAATRYQDVIGGIEIDFVRGQFLFPRGKGPERAYLITKLVEEVRAHLDGLAAKNKRPYYLAVRVPPSLETSMWAGLDVKTWMQRDLVDVVIPSQLMTIAGDQPVDDFVRIGRATGVKVHPAILSRQNASWPMADDPRRTGPRGNEAPAARAEDVIGVASNYYSMGADGLQLYNWAARAWVASPWFKTMTRHIATASSVTQHDAVFSVPPAYYFDVENTYEPRKQIPAKLTPGAPQQLTLFVGADPSKAAPQGVTLRLGFDVASRPGLAVRLDINGTSIPVPRAGEGLIATPASRPASSYVAPRHYAPPGSFLYVPVDPKVLRAGANTVQVVVNEPVTLMEFRLAMRRGR